MQTTSKQESIDIFNDYLEEMGQPRMTEKELIDWNIQGGETNQQLKEMASDLASEAESVKCENKNSWRYQH